MTPAERKAWKVRLSIRKQLNDRQYQLQRIHCNSCPEDKERRDPEKKCGGCAIYTELLKIGEALVSR